MDLLPFAEWPLRAELRDALAQGGFTTPTAVQTEAFQPVMDGRDLLVQSRTGTGKTLAFGLPILEGLTPGKGKVEALIIAPTRELAVQVGLVLGRLAHANGMEVATLYGGGSYRDQFRSLERARIAVGTPGRLCDHLERKSLDLSHCRILVLDEADEMLDMGFAEELDRIIGAMPKDRQTLLFSATLPPETASLASKAQRNPMTIKVSSGLTAAPEIAHVGYEIYPDSRADALVNVLHAERPSHAIVFCHTKEETERLTERLEAEGFKAAFLNGDLPQATRSRVLSSFRRRQIGILVATDVAARGIDVKGISHVINLGVPRDPETYVHRVGRTGRAGETGVAITFVPPRDALRFRRMLGTAGINLTLKPLPQADDVRVALRARTHEQMVARVQDPLIAPYHLLAEELLAYLDPRELVAALLSRDDVAHASLEAGLDINVPKPRSEVKASKAPVREGALAGAGAGKATAPRAPRVERPRDDEDDNDGPKQHKKPLRAMKDHQEAGMGRIHVNVGKAQRLLPGRLVQLVCAMAELTGQSIGMIEIHQHFTFFDVKSESVNKVVESLTGRNFLGKKLKANFVPPGAPIPQQ